MSSPLPRNQRGGQHSLAGEGAGGANSHNDRRESLALYVLCGVRNAEVYYNYMYMDLSADAFLPSSHTEERMKNAAMHSIVSGQLSAEALPPFISAL